MHVDGGMEELLLDLLCADSVDETILATKKREFSKRFEDALREVMGIAGSASPPETAACVRRSVSSFFMDAAPAALETFLVRVATMLLCYTTVNAANVVPSQLPEGVKTAAIAIARVFFSQRLGAVLTEMNGEGEGGGESEGNDDDGGAGECSTSSNHNTNIAEDNKNNNNGYNNSNNKHNSSSNTTTTNVNNNGTSDGYLHGQNALWFCFLCVFFQQLSAKGGDFTPWQQFFRDCAAKCKRINTTQVVVVAPHGKDKGPRQEEEYDGENYYYFGIAAWGAVSEETFNNTVCRTRFRRTAILCKSFCPHLVAQAPGTTFQLLYTFHAFITDWRNIKRGKWNEAAREEAEEKRIVVRYSEELGEILGEGRVHAFLLCTVIGALLSYTYILSSRGARGEETVRWNHRRRDAEMQKEKLWRQKHFPPIGLLLEHLHIRPLLEVHIFAFCMQLCLGLSPVHHTEGRQKLAICLYLTEICSLRTALAIYHFASMQLSPSLLDTESAALYPGDGIAKLTAAFNDYVDKAHSELVFASVDADNSNSNNNNNNNNNSRKRYRSGVSTGNSDRQNQQRKEREGEFIPVNGELKGPRFSRMVFPIPCPTWGQYLAESTPVRSAAEGASMSSRTAAAATNTNTHNTNTSTTTTTTASAFTKQTASPQNVTACRFVLELLEIGLPAMTSGTIMQMMTEMGMNVCLVPAAAMSGAGSISSNVYQRVQAFLLGQKEEEEKEKERKQQQQQEGGGDVNLMSHPFAFSASLRFLDANLPLLSTISPYLAQQTLLCSLVETLTAECNKLLCFEQEATGEGEEKESNVVDGYMDERNDAVICCKALALAEEYLIRVVMPCMRVLSPSPILYDRIQLLLLCMKKKGPMINFGTNPVEFLHINAWLNWILHPSPHVALRVPHDVRRSKELETLFTQSLKRMTQSNVVQYRSLLKPVIYANPLFLGDKLFQLAVGYGNNFLQIHTQLLKGAPAAILTLITHEGLLLMRRYAEEERIGSADANRVGLIATFLSVLWRDNPHTFDGGILLRAAEYALRNESRASIVFGLELLKSILHEMLDLTLEHEEQYSVAQVKALLAPSCTQWFAKGAAESFRRGRWDAFLTPAVLVATGCMLREALQENCAVPIEKEDNDNEEDNEEKNVGNNTTRADRRGEGSSTLRCTVGQYLLLHLCRLHGEIYRIQADLPGTMEVMLLTTAKDHSVINDLLLSMEGLLPQGPPANEIFMVAMPHVALRLTARFAAKEAQRAMILNGQRSGNVDAIFHVSPSDIVNCTETALPVNTMNSVIPFAVLQKLSHYTAAHFVFEESVYNSAGKEVNEFFNHATALVKVHNNPNTNNNNNSYGNGGGSATTATTSTLSMDPSIRCLQEQTGKIRAEKEYHRKLYQQAEASRNELFEDLRRSGALNEPVAFAVSYLLPRALLSLEDTLFVYYFMKWLLDKTSKEKTKKKERENNKNGGADGSCKEEKENHYERVVDVALSIITAAMTFFVGLTDGECKRVGFLLALLRAALHESTGDVSSFPPFNNDNNDNNNVVNNANITTTTTTSAADVPSTPPTLTTEALMSLLEPKPRPLTSLIPHITVTDNTETTKKKNVKDSLAEKDDTARNGINAESPAYLIQLEAYLTRALVQLLVHQQDINFLQRNVFLILERLTKGPYTFPSTLFATEWLIKAIAPHAVQKSSCYASATAVMKVLKSNQQKMREMLVSLFPHQVTQTTLHMGTNAQEKQLERWQQFWKMREMYIRSLLLADVEAAESRGNTAAVEAVSSAATDIQDEEETEVVEAGEAASDVNNEDGEPQIDEEEEENGDVRSNSSNPSEFDNSSFIEERDDREEDNNSIESDNEEAVVSEEKEEHLTNEDINTNEFLCDDSTTPPSFLEGGNENSNEVGRKRGRDAEEKKEKDVNEEGPPVAVARLENNLNIGEENL